MTSKEIDFGGLACFLYRSTAVEGISNADLKDILLTARGRNAAAGLTGCLHHEAGLFFQWLEGPKEALNPVVQSILRDTRHREVIVLQDGALDQRRFQDWRMRFTDRDQGSLMDWFAQSGVSTVNQADYAQGIVAFLKTI